MARVTGKNGAVALPSGFNGDFASWTARSSQIIDDDTSYSDTGTGASHSGCGTMTNSLTARAFVKSNVASSEPGIASQSVAGGTATLTAHTGCTFAGTCIMGDVEVVHAKRSGAITCDYSGMVDGDWTPTWATS